MFRVTSRLLESRITFFTRSPCSLCDTAKAVVQNVKKERNFTYEEINVMEPGQEGWKTVYEFDTPVIHIDPTTSNPTSTSSPKLMHRFDETQVKKLLDEAKSA
ncbi:glutaredoxin 2 [Bimuria novae-zelandiae CBS 107.79]|uniref:Glutaredoxin-like protein n=1 Tax=Bimuria novae-zelandiae CBS 107.79 TaxID=1447943 RepID=A0A6A5V4Y5_9PLEO|nr:glutaredoxin 2 [Bimuria novae-zelandiae CBS 107.79]